MTDRPLEILELHHVLIEIWPTHVATVFKSDGAVVPAVPTEGQTLLQTAIHEALHSMIAEARADTPSECLRAVADGDGKRWTEARLSEEALAFSLTVRLVQLVDSLKRAGQL